VLVARDTPSAERLAALDGWRVAGRDKRAVLFVRAQR
jgi:hypothetical protein